MLKETPGGKVAVLAAFFLGTLLAAHAVHAQVNPLLLQGVRPAGMGGAFITLSNDENALFYNPAGLNDVNGFGGVEIINPLVDINENGQHLLSDVRNLNGNPAEVAGYLDQHIGQYEHIQAALFPNLVVHNFAAGFLVNGLVDLDVRNRVTSTVNANIHLDTGLLVGAATDFFNKGLQIGVTGKAIRRDGIDREYTLTDIESGQFDPYHQRTHHNSLAFDLGAKVNLPILLHPTFAVVGQNLGNLNFQEAGYIGQQVNVGAAINPVFWILKTTLAAEVDDVARQQPNQTDFYTRLHIGAEVRFPKILSVRAGLNQGYPAAGATLDFRYFKVLYAAYAEELGAYAGQRKDRRQEVQVSLGF